MKRHKIKYPLTILLCLSVLAFWGTLCVRGYELKLDGTVVKRGEDLTAEVPKEPVPPAETPKDKEDAGADTNEDSNKDLPPDNNAEDTPAEPEKPAEKKEFITAEQDYLDGALFIGDSRTSVLYEYAGWTNTHFFVEYGLSVWDVMDKQLATDPETGEKITVREALSTQHYDKIYIMLGINELGRGTADTFCAQYAKVVDEIRSLQPDAVIFIQSIMHVSAKKDAQGTYINNAEINARNEKIMTLADGIQTFWLDENEVFDLEDTGTLNPDYTWDGVHLQAKYIPLWKDFLLSHAIEIS